MATPTESTGMKSAKTESVESYPKEIASSLNTFKDSLHDVENVLAPLINASMPDVHNQVSLSFTHDVTHVCSTKNPCYC